MDFIIDRVLKIIFQVFTFEPLLVALGFPCVLGFFGILKRIITGDWRIRS